jgi:hypothetical protein
VANSIEQFLADIAALGEIYPQMMDLVDPDKAALELQRARGAPTAIMRSKKEVEAMRAARAEQEAQQQELMMAQQAGDSMKAVGEGAAAMDQSEETMQ